MAKKLRNSTPEIDEWDEIEFFDLDNFDDLANDSKDKSGLKYVKNVFKSVKNLSVKLGEALLPETSKLGSELKNAGSEFRDQFTDFKDKAIDQISKLRSKASSGKTINKEAIGQEATKLFSDLKKDISDRFKTGKFVKGPEDEEFDLGSFGFGDDDSEASSESQNQPTLKEPKDPNAPTRLRITQTKNRNKKLQFEVDNERFQSLKEATLGASEASVAASIDMFQKSQMLEEARHHVTTQYLKNMAVNLYKLTGIQGQALAANVEYGKKSLALYGDLTRFIKEIHEMQSATYRENEKFKANRKGSGSKIADVFGYGFSGSEWAKHVVGNVKDAVSMSPIGMMIGMLPMLDMMNMGGGSGAGGAAKNLVKSLNPFNILLNLTMSSKMKEGRERIEKMFSAIPTLINQKFVSMSSEGGLRGLIGSLLGIRDEQGVVKTEKYANMNLDAPSSLDVRTKRTINEVMPLQLAQIVAALTGREETRYDFRTGKFRTVSSIQRQRQAVVETAMRSDWDFARATDTIMTGAMTTADGRKVNVKKAREDKDYRNSLITNQKLADGIKAINMHLVNAQQGFEFNKLVDPKTRTQRTDSDARYYKKWLLSKVKGNEAEKEAVFQAFVAGYNNLLDDQSMPGGAQFYKVGMALTKSNLNRGLSAYADETDFNIQGGFNTISTGQHDKLIKQIDDKIELWKKKAKDKTLGMAQMKIGEQIADLQMKKAQLLGESGGGFVNATTASISDQNAYDMEQRFLSVPNMLKNITEILLHGIVVYPVTGEIPESTKKFLQGQKDYLSSATIQARKDIEKQLETEKKARDEVNRTNFERLEFQRKIAYGRETGLAVTPIGRMINKFIGGAYNFFNQGFLAPLAGFDPSVDFNDDRKSLTSSAESLADKTGKVRGFAEKAAERGGIIGTIGKILLGVTASVEQSVDISDDKQKEESQLATKVKQEVSGIRGKIKELIDKSPWLSKQLDFITNHLTKHPEEAVDISNEINQGAAEGKPIETVIANIADSRSEENFYENLQVGNVKGSKNKNINKSRVISNSYNKTKNYYNMDTAGIESRLDKLIEIIETKTYPEDGYKVSGMEEVISLLVSMNANLMNPQQMNQIAGEIQKEASTKKPLWKKILGFPKAAARKLKDAGVFVGSRASSAIGTAGSWLGNMLPGLGSMVAGGAQGLWEVLKFGGSKIAGGLGWAGKGLFGLGKKGINKASEVLNQSKTRVRQELDQLAENGGLNIDTILARFSKEELIQKVASITGKSEEELANLSSEQLAQELLNFWKSKAGSGLGGVVEGLGNAVKGAFGFGKEALKQGGDAVKGVAKAGWDATKSITSNLGNLIFGDGKIGGGGLLNLSVGGGSKNVAIMKGILANTIAIRGLLENKFEMPADMSSANAQAEEIARSGKSILGRAASLIGKGIKGIGNFIKSIPSRIKGLYTGIKNKVAGFRDRGDGSGVAEGSYADYKKDAEEAKIEKREENKEEQLEAIAQNTTLLAEAAYNMKFQKNKEEKKGGGFNIKNIKGIGGLLAGGALIAGGTALFAGNMMANKKKKEQYQSQVENGTMTQEEADREGKFDNVEKGNQMARSVVMAIKGVDKVLNFIFTKPPINKFIKGPTKNIIQKAIVKAITKFAPRLGARLAAFIGIGAGTAGISTAAQALAGFGWGMMRASSYFKSILQPGEKITLAMRVTAGLVKALDFALMGIPDIICTFMGTNPVLWIYNMLKDVIGGPKKTGEAAAAVATAGTATSSVKGGEDDALAESTSANPDPLKEMQPSLTKGSLSPEIAVTGSATLATINQSTTSEGQKAIEKANVNYFYANVASLANLISIRKLLELQIGIPSSIDQDQIEAEKIASTGERMSAGDSGSMMRNMVSGVKRKGRLASAIKNIAGKIGSTVSNFLGWGGEKLQEAGETIQNYAANSDNQFIRGAGTIAGSVVQKGGEFVSSIPQTVKDISEKIKNFVTGADVSGLRPIAKQRLAGLAEDYYRLYGKKLKINSGSRTMAKQEELYRKSQANQAAIAAGKSVPYPGIGKAARPNPLSPHIAGVAIDVNSSEVMKMKKDGLLDKWGWYQAAYRPDLPITDSASEFWHLEILGSRSKSSTSKTGWAPVTKENLDYIDMIQNQSIDGNVSSLKAVGSGGNESIVKGGSEINDPGSIQEMINIPNNSSQTSVSHSSSSSSNNYESNEQSTSSSSSTTTSSSSSSSSVRSSNTGANDMQQNLGEVSGLVKIMEKIEENTKRSADILAEHLPQLGNIFQVLGAILQATMNNSNGGSSSSPDADMAAAIIAKANY